MAKRKRQTSNVDNDKKPTAKRMNFKAPADETKSWHADTKPYKIVRFFARQDVKNKEIKRILKQNSIHTLQNLKARCRLLDEIVDEERHFDLVGAIASAMQRNNVPLEELLGGTAIYDTAACLPAGDVGFNLGAVSVRPNNLSNRGSNFTLVLGPSGSGKTFFALYRIPRLIVEQQKIDDDRIFIVHVQADKILELMKKVSIPDFPQAVASFVERKIESKIAKAIRGASSSNDKKFVQLFLHVVIDEAGGDQYKDYFATAASIKAIVTALEDSMSIKFERGVHLSLAGTRLETTTSEINSLVDCTKFRMQSWTLGNFDCLVNASSHTNKPLVIDVVRRFPILESMVSNARCAAFVLDSMTEASFLQMDHVKQFVNVIISSVAASYARSNGLQKLELSTDKWGVVKSVFQAVDQAAQQPLVAFIPKFESLKSDQLRSIASCLIGVNVEICEGLPKFMEDNVISVSMSPAVAIVLANLLNDKASIAWDWQAFESTVALCEWKWMIVHSIGTPSSVNRTILELRAPLPVKSRSEVKGGVNIVVPVVNRFTVVLNGPVAAYADVIAPFRLVQAKYSDKGEETVRYLDLLLEIGKMGLTKTSEWQWQQAVTSALYKMWESDEEIEPAGFASVNRLTEKRSGYYPYNSLLPRWVHGKHAEAVLQLNHNNERHAVAVMRKDKDHNEETLVVNDIIGDFNENRPVTAVFVTNCKRIVLKGTTVHINPSDVDWEGKLIAKELPEKILRSLRGNTLIRFMFC